MPCGTSRSCTTSFRRLRSCGVGDLAGNAAAARRVGHQHRIAAGQRQIGGQRRALVAALFLDDLHQQDLPALDDFLDLVVAAHRLAAAADFLQRVLGADRFHLVIVGVRWSGPPRRRRRDRSRSRSSRRSAPRSHRRRRLRRSTMSARRCAPSACSVFSLSAALAVAIARDHAVGDRPKRFRRHRFPRARCRHHRLRRARQPAPH